MSEFRDVPEDELHAYVDGGLDAARRADVRRYLQDHPDVASRVASWTAQREALRGAFGPIAGPVPPRLELQRLVQQRLDRRWQPWRIAASILLAFALGGAGGWLLHERAGSGDVALLAQAAAANHTVYAADRRRPTELGADQRDDLVRWVSNRLNHHVAAPDLEADGFKYMGGRLAATEDGPAGLFMYVNARGVRVTVFVLPLSSAAAAPMRNVDVAGLNSCVWIDKGIGYTVVGDLPYKTLWQLAEQVQRQLEASS